MEVLNPATRGTGDGALKRWSRLCSAWLVIILASGAYSVPAEEAGEYDLKAALLVKVTAFVTWPLEPGEEKTASAGDKKTEAPRHISIGILGDDPFGESLDALVKRASTASLEMECKRLTDVTQANTCDVLFVCPSLRAHYADILNAATDMRVLTVADFPGFAEGGGMVELGLEGQHIALVINREAVEKAGLSVSSKLLSLAKVVGGGEADPNERSR